MSTSLTLVSPNVVTTVVLTFRIDMELFKTTNVFSDFELG